MGWEGEGLGSVLWYNCQENCNSQEKENTRVSRRQLVGSVMLLLLLLTSCAPPGSPAAGQVKKTPPTRGSPSLPMAAVTPVTPMLGRVPQNCPTSRAHRQVISPNLSAVIGTSPVWATWAPGPSVYREPSISQYLSSYDSPYGWEMTKVIWEVRPNYMRPITISGDERFDHTPLLIQLGGDGTPTQHAVLDSLHPDHPISVVGDKWAEWGSYIVAPKAGCYSLDVAWATGHWMVTFAFGA